MRKPRHGAREVAAEAEAKRVKGTTPSLAPDHWHFDTFQARWRNSTMFTQTLMPFELGRDGTVVRLSGDYFGSFPRRI